MAYVTYNDIENEFKNTAFSASTKLTSTEVTEIITQTENRVNAELGQVYVTPVTNTTDISILKTIVIYFVKHRVTEILALRSGEELDDDAETSLETKAQKLLDKIIQKKLLHNTTRKTTNNAGVEDYNYNNDIHAEFDLTNEQENTDYGMKDKSFW